MAGYFECQAKNDNGEKSAKAHLDVVSQTTIVAGPKDTEAQVKSSVRINCSVAWDPAFELTISWKKNNVDMYIDNQRITIGKCVKTVYFF